MPLGPGTLLNVNVPAGDIAGVDVCRLGKRIYRDRLSSRTRRRAARGAASAIYGTDPDYEREEGTDLAAVAAGRIALTPIHFDLTDAEGVETLSRVGLDRLMEAA